MAGYGLDDRVLVNTTDMGAFSLHYHGQNGSNA
jgi:hypothetical protein